jgi:hypothetical protein
MPIGREADESGLSIGLIESFVKRFGVNGSFVIFFLRWARILLILLSLGMLLYDGFLKQFRLEAVS